MSEALVNIKGMGLITVPDTLIGGNERGAALYRNIDGMDRANPDSPFAGLRSRAAKQNAWDDKVQGVLSGIGNQIADVAINDEGGLNNPAQLKAALDNKFQEVRNFTDMVTQGLTPLQKAAFLTMGVNGLGDITGLAADAEMYFTDPESRTWFNAMMSGAGVAGGAVSISPSMAAMLPIIRKNIDAWQGSPHKFDRMSSAHIGTGEGAEAYGHGLYFAEQKGIGEGYRERLSAGKRKTQIGNKLGMPDSYEGELFVNQLETNKGDITETLKDLDRYANSFKADGDYQQYNTLTAFGDRVREAYPNGGKLNIEDNFGYLYNVDLKVSPDDLLDWDAMIDEQPAGVAEKLRNTDWYSYAEESLEDMGSSAGANPTGREIYKWLEQDYDPEEVSKLLNEAGIPGIRYLDGGSRSAGEGTRNFVIFDDSLIEIKKRNGEVLTPVQREAAVAEMTPGAGVRPKNKSDDPLFHPLGGQSAAAPGKKLRMPVSEMSRDVTPLGNLSEKRVISPEDLYGSGLVPALGDRSDAGGMLQGLNGVGFENPIMLEGGHGFMRSHEADGAAWASGQGVVKSLTSRVQDAAQLGDGSVNMVYMPMSHKGVDFSTMMSDTLFEGIRGGKITKKAKKEFDSALRGKRPEWLGIDNPEARQQLHTNGALRHAFNSTVGAKGFQASGFPDLESARFAITDPDLLDTKKLHGGQSIASMDPQGGVISDPAVPHNSYDTQIKGGYVGGFETPIPYDVLFPDFVKGRRALGTDAVDDGRSFDFAKPTQHANQEWLDGVMSYIRANPK